MGIAARRKENRRRTPPTPNRRSISFTPSSFFLLFRTFFRLSNGLGSEAIRRCEARHDDIKKHQKYLYAIFVIKDGEILVEKTVTKQAGSYETFLKDLSVKDEAGKDLCRYAFYDYEYQFNPQGGDSVMRSKLFLLNWCPETSAIKNKMLYASSFDSLKRAFEGVKILQANDFSDIEKDAVEKELRALGRT